MNRRAHRFSTFAAAVLGGAHRCSSIFVVVILSVLAHLSLTLTATGGEDGFLTTHFNTHFPTALSTTQGPSPSPRPKYRASKKFVQERSMHCLRVSGFNENERTECAIQNADGQFTEFGHGCYQQFEPRRRSLRLLCPLHCKNAMEGVILSKLPSSNHKCTQFYNYGIVGPAKQTDFYLWRSELCLNETIEFEVRCIYGKSYRHQKSQQFGEQTSPAQPSAVTQSLLQWNAPPMETQVTNPHGFFAMLQVAVTTSSTVMQESVHWDEADRSFFEP